MTTEEHNKYLAWTFIGHGAFQLLLWVLVMVFIFLILPPSRGGDPPRAFIWTMIAFMTVFQSLFVIPSFVAAWGLLKHKSWARVASIIAGVIAALNVPLGTAACAYSMWFFLGDKWKEVYGEPGPSQDAERRILADDLNARWTGMRTDEKGEVT